MTPNEYQQLASRTICDQHRAIVRISSSPHDRHQATTAIQLNHAVMGIGGEQGELCTALQRWIYYGKTFDPINFQEELGDVLWYVAEACEALGVKMEDVMARNIAKLQTRYPDKYTDHRAAEENRDRAAERSVLELDGDNVEEINQILAADAYRNESIDAMQSEIDRPVLDAARERLPTILGFGQVVEQHSDAQEFIKQQTGPRPATPLCHKCKSILNKGYCAECGERTV